VKITVSFSAKVYGLAGWNNKDFVQTVPINGRTFASDEFLALFLRIGKFSAEDMSGGIVS
jgi:hypothetical protein